MAESFIITGGVSWGLALAGPASAGRVIAWVGMAMFAALALGAPLGSLLYAAGGFTAVAIVTAFVPLATILIVAPLRAAPPQHDKRPALLKVAAAVWMPGLGSALSSIGFGTMIGFSSLLSAERQWRPLWLLFSVFAASLVAVRLLWGHLPDRIGGAGVALMSVLIEAAGLVLIWRAGGESIAAAGALLTGAGFALVYPGLGVEAVRRTPAQSRGLAMGAYTAPGFGAWVWQSCAGIDRGLDGPGFGVSRGRGDGAWRRRYHDTTAVCAALRDCVMRVGAERLAGVASELSSCTAKEEKPGRR